MSDDKVHLPKKRLIYTAEFRKDAVDLVLHHERPLKQVARELGVSATSLRAWVNETLGAGSAGAAEPGRKPGEQAEADSPQGLQARLRRLERENEYLRRQRDILKKAMSILGEDPHLGMR